MLNALFSSIGMAFILMIFQHLLNNKKNLFTDCANIHFYSSRTPLKFLFSMLNWAICYHAWIYASKIQTYLSVIDHYQNRWMNSFDNNKHCECECASVFFFRLNFVSYFEMDFITCIIFVFTSNVKWIDNITSCNSIINFFQCYIHLKIES